MLSVNDQNLVSPPAGWEPGTECASIVQQVGHFLGKPQSALLIQMATCVVLDAWAYRVGAMGRSHDQSLFCR